MKTRKPKILLYDLETSPIVALVWNRYNIDSVAKVKRESELLSFSYKYLGEKKVHVESRNEFKLNGDKTLCKKLHKLLGEADIVIAHNGIQFDNKKSFARFIKHKLPALPRLTTIDTKRVAKNNFGFSSNSLDALGEFLGLGRKRETGGIDLWDDCMAGKKEAFKKMSHYNKGDVSLLERVYEEMKPWMPNHPTGNLLGNGVCPTCSSTKMQKRGVSRTHKSIQQRLQCQECGSWTSVAIPRIAKQTKK